MKRIAFQLLPVLTAASLWAQSGPSNNVPEAISYQGRVSDAAGVFIGDAAPVNRKVTLKIWSGPQTTNPGDVLYAEEQTVTISKGLFSVLIGEGTAVLGLEGKKLANVSQILHQKERFLGVTVDDGTPTADPEVSPRQRLVSSAFSLRAKYAEVSERTNFADVANSARSVTAGANDSSTFNLVSAKNFTVDGHSKITGGNVLEFGVGNTKAATAGQIGYQRYSNGLDIVGAGTTDAERRIHLWADAGTTFHGPIFWDIPNGGLGQHINLWGNSFGSGVQNNTFYHRSPANHAWYRGGAHHNDALNAGGGSLLAYLDEEGFTVNSGNLTVSNGAINGVIDRFGHGIWARSFGAGHSVGSQDWTTWSRSPRNFAWYVGGSYNGGELNAGGGTMLARLNNSGMHLSGNLEGQDIKARGTLRADGNVEVVDLKASGWAFAHRLSFNNTWQIHAPGEFRVDDNGNTKFRVDAAGDCFAKRFNNTSDRNLKKDFKPFGTMLPQLMKLKPMSYRYKSDPDGTPLSFGFIAQEIQDVFPNLVKKGEEKYLALDSMGFIPVAVAAIQEQQKQIEVKDAEIATLKKELAAAQAVNAKQDTRLAAIEKALKLETKVQAAKTAAVPVSTRR